MLPAFMAVHHHHLLPIVPAMAILLILPDLLVAPAVQGVPILPTVPFVPGVVPAV